MEQNVLVVSGGGPSAVINASLYGVIEAARESGKIGKVYAAIGGSEGILKERFLNLLAVPEEQLRLLPGTPGTAIGSSRYALTEEDYRRMPGIFRKYGIRYVLPNGGNGTMDTCGHIFEACRDAGAEVFVVGIPKTVDNDIALTDHTPGYGSAARFLAATTAEIGADVRALPIHVSIIEAMGRNAGWITAASVLARRRKGDAPHLIYLPERAFCEAEFLEDVAALHKQLGGVVVVASEGLRRADGQPIVPPIFQTGRSVYYGDIGAYLAELVIKKLGIKARSEKPGISGRASIAWQSETDRREAELVGRSALSAALSGESGVMIGLFREETPDGSYAVRTAPVPIAEVMLYEKKLPENYINERGNDVTAEFADWCRPLIGGPFREFIDFQEMYQAGR